VGRARHVEPASDGRHSQVVHEAQPQHEPVVRRQRGERLPQRRGGAAHRLAPFRGVDRILGGRGRIGRLVQLAFAALAAERALRQVAAQRFQVLAGVGSVHLPRHRTRLVERESFPDRQALEKQRGRPFTTGAA